MLRWRTHSPPFIFKEMRPMDGAMVATQFENVDRRLARVEQILPTLATKDDLKSLATKEELRLAIEPLATREELRLAIEPLATKEELREEGEKSRRHLTMLIDHVLSLRPRRSGE
jgi:hypothetical protein